MAKRSADDYVPVEVRDAALSDLLEKHPDAPIASTDAVGLFVPLAPDLLSPTRPELAGQGAIHLVVPAERVAMLRAWETCVKTGMADVTLSLLAGGEATFHFVDGRERYGTFVVLLVPSADGPRRTVPLGSAVGPMRPRFGVTLRNELAAFVLVDAAATAMLGWELEDLTDVVGLQLIHPDDQDRAIENWLSMLADPSVPYRWRGRHRCKDGGWLWIEFTTYNELAEHGHVRSELYDISGEMAAIDALQDRERLLREIAEAMPVGVVRFDHDGAIVFVNSHALDTLGVSTVGTIADLVAVLSASDGDALVAAVATTRASTRAAEVQVAVARDGGVRTVDCRVRRLGGRAGEADDAVMTLTDVTESVELRDELARRASTDGLTGVLNRAATYAVLATIRDGSAVVYLDLDGFKQVNDLHGHAAGDAVLCAVAERLTAAVGDAGHVGRLGGDEFVAIALGVRDADAALEVARRIAAAVAHDVQLAATTVPVCASFGVTWVGDGGGVQPDAIVARADAAMYRSKQAGAGAVVLADP